MRKPFRPGKPRPFGHAPVRSDKPASGSSAGGHERRRRNDPRIKSPPASKSAKRRETEVKTEARRLPETSGDGADHRRDHAKGHHDLVFGVEPIRELIVAAPATIPILYIRRGLEGRFAAEAAAIRQHGGRVALADDDELTRMAGAAARHQGIVAGIREYRYAAITDVIERNADPIVIIDGVTDPRNLGAILRSAECAGVRAIVIAKNRTAGITPAAIKASAGSWIHLTIAQCGNVVQALEALKAAGYWIAALAPDGDTSIYGLDATRKLAIVLGSEDRGVRELVRKHADFAVNIPMHGQVASLNVSVAAAVALFEIERQRMNLVPAQ